MQSTGTVSCVWALEVPCSEITACLHLPGRCTVQPQLQALTLQSLLCGYNIILLRAMMASV